jgi:YhcH/YjgK/YiaL family protein
MIYAYYKDLIIPEKYMNANWEKALAWLKGDAWKDIGEGRTEINGTGAYASRSSYKTKLPGEGQYETHRLYADIQMMIRGTEIILICYREDLKVTVPYSPEKDVVFFDGKPRIVHQAVLSGSTALVVFPEDAHKPCQSFRGEQSMVEKLVIKVALNG